MIARVEVCAIAGLYQGRVGVLSSDESICELFCVLEEVVDGQVLSMLDAVELRIEALAAVLETSSTTIAIEDLQIFPSEMAVSFRRKSGSNNPGQE